MDNAGLIQEHFNIAYLAIIKQGKPSMRDGRCVYRAPDGSRCAFGYLLKDKDYKLSMEHQKASTVILKYKLKGFADDRFFYDLLQICHDSHAGSTFNRSVDFLKYFKIKMKTLAKEYKLTIPKISKEK